MRRVGVLMATTSDEPVSQAGFWRFAKDFSEPAG